jgi:type II secretory pathway component PulK
MIDFTSRRGIHKIRRARRGAVLIIVIAVFAVVMALAAVWAKRVVVEHRRQRRVEQHAQAQWLAEAGVRRAAARLSLDPGYDGETWTIAANELNQRTGAKVEITAEPIEPIDGAAQYRLTARARYPEPEPRVQATKTIEFIPTPSEPAS